MASSNLKYLFTGAGSVQTISSTRSGHSSLVIQFDWHSVRTKRFENRLKNNGNKIDKRKYIYNIGGF